MQPQRVADDLPDPLARVERGVGVLEDHLHLAPQRPHLACARGRRSPGPRSDRARGRLEQLQDRRGRGSTCRSPTRRPGRASRPRADVRLTPSTARTWSTSRSIRSPRLIGKCLTRSVTSSSGSPWPCTPAPPARSGPRPARSSRFCSRVEPAAVARGRARRAAAPRAPAARVQLLEGVRAARAGSGSPAAGASSEGGAPPICGRRCGRRLVEPGQRAEQAPGVGVLGVVEDLVERALLDDLARVHDQHPVGDLGDDAEVVGDQDRRQAALAVEPLEQLRGSAPGS